MSVASKAAAPAMAWRGDQFVGCCRHVKPSGLGLRWNGFVDSTARVCGRPGAQWSNRGWKFAFVQTCCIIWRAISPGVATSRRLCLW
jgi:hypothetical protein